MKTYVITLSREFPKGHPKHGAKTFFKVAFKYAQMCAKCKDKPQGMCMGECVVGYIKRHTIRANYDLWAERFKEIESGNACLSVREWTGKPYRSKQREIARLTREDGIGIQKLTIAGMTTHHPVFVDGHSAETKKLANNDGLNVEDWHNWFSGYKLTEPMAVIHFTNFRY